MLVWNKHPKRDETIMADRRTWKTKCGHYQVVESNIKYGRHKDHRGNFLGYPVYYLAMRSEEGIWQIISEHRRRSTAVAQCEYFHQHGRKMPPKTKAAKAVKRVKAKRLAKREQRNESSDT